MTLSRTIIDLLQRHRLPLADEKRTQEAMAVVLSGDGLYYRREYALGEGDIVDFLVLNDTILPLTGVAIEVKIGGSRRSHFRQLERYARHGAVSEIILATNVPMTLPPRIGGKLAFIASLGRGWL